MSDRRRSAMLILALINLVVIYSIFAVRVGAIDQETVVGLWLFDEGKGDTAGDSSENGNDGSVVQSNWVDGKFGDAIEFTGAGYVEVPASDSLNSIGDEITIAAWIKFTDLTAWARIITRGVFQDKDNLQFILASTDKPEFVNLELHSKGQTFAIWNQQVLEQDVWHHIAYTSDGAQLKLYVDGALKTSGGSGKPLNKLEDQSLFFGSGINAPGGAPGSAQKFKGAMDEVAIFNKALSEDEVKELLPGIQVADQPVELQGKLTTTWGSIKEK
ncbi:LamG domain-containing protein [Candidatus Poribacteria bacterium]